MGSEVLFSTTGLCKSYGKVRALNGVDLSLHKSEILVLVGANGAGKTTFVECVLGLRKADGGTIQFAERLGRNPIGNKIGVVFQNSGLPSFAGIPDTLWLWSSFADDPLNPKDLLDKLGVGEKYKVMTRFGALSGGQKHKILIALALLRKPAILVLDEPTTGLDPESRAGFWDIMDGLREEGLSILVTTHNLDEAQDYGNRTAIINDGKVAEVGTYDELLQKFNINRVFELRLPRGVDGSCKAEFEQIPEISHVVTKSNRLLVFSSRKGQSQTIAERIKAIVPDLSNFRARDATLEDMFFIVRGGKDLESR